MDTLHEILGKASWAFEEDAEGNLEKIRFNLGGLSAGSDLDILMPTSTDGDPCILNVLRFASLFKLLYSIGFNACDPDYGSTEISFEGCIGEDGKRWWIRFFCKMNEEDLDHVYNVKKGKITKQ